MSSIKYESDLVIIYYPVKAKLHDKPEILSIPVHSFEVDGGASRKIDLNSTNESSIASEFEQARAHANVIFYIPPTKDFLAVKLINISQSEKKNFNMTFDVSVKSEGKTLRMLSIRSYAAKFVGTPIPVGDTPPLLKAKVSLYSPELVHGLRDEKQPDEIYLEKI